MNESMKKDMEEMNKNPVRIMIRTLSYDTVSRIEMKAGQIETRCCRSTYETGKLKCYNDKMKEKPCTKSLHKQQIGRFRQKLNELKVSRLAAHPPGPIKLGRSCIRLKNLTPGRNLTPSRKFALNFSKFQD